MAIISGFDGDRTAVAMKIHHTITDGVGGVAMAAALFDLTDEPDTDLGPRPAEPVAEVLDTVGRVRNGVQFATRNVLGRGWSLGRGAVGLTAATVTHPRQVAGAGSEFAFSAARLLAPASDPLSPLMRKRSLSTHLAVLVVPFRELKAAGKANGCTLNDAYMTAVAGGIRTYHEAHRSPAREVRVNMPVNLRTGPDVSAGNRWVPALFPMPIDDVDPVARMRRLSPVLKQARTEPALALSDSVYRLLAVLPRSVTTSITAGMMKGCDVAVTNVPGPPIALYSAGALVEVIAPFAPKAGAALNVALMSYNGMACVGVNIDTRAIPDPEVMIEHLVAGFDEVIALSGGAARTKVVAARE
jgi:WS/DGAT/MGAT family acyltransferase